MDFHEIFINQVAFPSTSVVAVQLQRVLVSIIDNPRYLSSNTDESNLIVDAGTPVCILPHCSDFVMYENSKMKIRDLSSSIWVAREQWIHCWSIQDARGISVHIDPFGYHIPYAEVHLLSPQCPRPIGPTLRLGPLTGISKERRKRRNGIGRC